MSVWVFILLLLLWLCSRQCSLTVLALIIAIFVLHGGR